MSIDERPLEEHWRELVSAALLGTDRRRPPALPNGPLADTVDDLVRPDDASRMIAAVAAMAAARRASFVPLDAEPLLQPPERDDRPMCSPTATHTWRSIIAEWSVLEDEWMLTLIELGYRLGPDLMVEMLVRHRNDAVRRTRVAIAAGPLAGWLSDHLPELQTKKAAAVKTVSAEAVATLPELAIPPELAELLVLDAHTFVQRLLPGFESLEYGPAHRAVLVNLLARCRPEVLVDAEAALLTVRTGLAVALADLCRLRHRMLSELTEFSP